MFLNSKEKILKICIISAFIAIVIFIVGTTIAMIVYPDYSFLEQFFSELGVREDIAFPEGGSLTKVEYPEIFNVSLIVAGIFLLPFFPALMIAIEPKGKISKILTSLTALSGLTGFGFLVCVGIFDAGKFIDQHIVAALGLYYSIIITCLLWGVSVLFLNKDSPYKKSKLWIIDPFASAVGVLIGIINTGFLGIHEWFIGKLTMAFYQKTLAYVFIVFFGFVAIRIIFIIKKDKKTNDITQN
ncbi:MAG: DUF998 domain-containing protein [Candidatus Thorarchaeota archaeon]